MKRSEEVVDIAKCESRGKRQNLTDEKKGSSNVIVSRKRLVIEIDFRDTL